MMSRYQRQLAIPGFSEDMQKRLLPCSVLVVGIGGLASACLPYLCGAGIGYIFIADGDVVELINLHRQTIFREEDIGGNKAELAAKHLSSLNSDVQIDAIPYFLNKENEAIIPEKLSLVIDCTDHIQTKYFLNDYCSERRIPFISASNFQWEGQLFILSNQQDAINIRSVFPTLSSSITNCGSAGALGPVLGMLGSAQALEALRVLTSLEPIINELIYFDFKAYRVHRLTIAETDHSIIRKQVFRQTELNNEEFETKLGKENVMVVDVRQRDEKPAAPFPCLSIPLNELETRLERWNKMQEIVFFCHSGIRSAHAVELLQRNGFNNVSHLRGGIIRYTSIKEKI